MCTNDWRLIICRFKVAYEDYLAGELISDIRHELIDGEIYVMSGAKATHNRISGNIFGEIRTQLKMSNCDAFTADMKVKAGANYFYPDVLVDCSELDGEALFADSPSVIFEVLSRFTRKMDETVKKIAYLNIPTLEEYILVEQVKWFNYIGESYSVK